MKAGDTLLIERPGTSYDSHLWIVISDPDIDQERVVIVNLTTWRHDKDQACVLDVGDHPYISHKTCVNYRGAKVWPESSFAPLFANSLVKSLEPVSPELLQRIRNGVLYSNTMPLEIAQILDEQGVIYL